MKIIINTINDYLKKKNNSDLDFLKWLKRGKINKNTFSSNPVDLIKILEEKDLEKRAKLARDSNSISKELKAYYGKNYTTNIWMNDGIGINADLTDNDLNLEYLEKLLNFSKNSVSISIVAMCGPGFCLRETIFKAERD